MLSFPTLFYNVTDNYFERMLPEITTRLLFIFKNLLLHEEHCVMLYVLHDDNDDTTWLL